jgi:hypothetical protein
MAPIAVKMVNVAKGMTLLRSIMTARIRLIGSW